MNGPFAAGIIAPTGGQANIDGGDSGDGFLPITAPFLSEGDGGYGGGGLNGGGVGGRYNGDGGGVSTGIIPNTRHGGGGSGSFVNPSGIGSAAMISDDQDDMDGWVRICITQIHAIPTMNQWGMFIMFLAFSIFGIIFMRHDVNANRGIEV
ncbi:MAG TPA: hypothetical protein PKC30_15170 [Saprospiraceae bacterium]|nr:hypothetical protein [Saprospiraceae bacterium]